MLTRGLPPDSSQHNASILINHHTCPSTNAKASPSSFAAYRAVLELRGEILRILPTEHEKLMPHLSSVLRNLAAGYFEYSKPDKIVFYRKAREELSYIWTEVDLLRLSSPSEQSGAMSVLSERILKDVMPILSGTLRKIELGEKGRKSTINITDDSNA